jgi:hypothetical protein
MTVMELENAKPIGVDMSGNVLKRGDISYECSIVIPNDAPVLAMLREEDKKIYKGDVFECIQHAVMNDGEVAYRKDKAYASEKDGCITDTRNDDQHEWDGSWQKYFKRV